MGEPRNPHHVVIIGAGIGGLTTGAILARAGLKVTVLEAHVYPGGCAGTFYHQGYRFDAGATLAGGFYPGGPMELVARRTGIDAWPAHKADPVMAVHLPNGQCMTRWAGAARWRERERIFGPAARSFWRWQERTADLLWELALRQPAWPPQSVRDAARLLGAGAGWLAENWRHLRPHLLADLFRPLSAHLQGASETLRLFADAQLLIASQAISTQTNALYGASALDLPRRGVVHLAGGMGAIAQRLAQAVTDNGGSVQYRQEATRIVLENERPKAVQTRRGQTFAADLVVANLPPWNVARLLGDQAPPRLRNLPAMPTKGGGAIMLYVGVDDNLIPRDWPLHHQVIVREPMGEGNTIFLSVSPAWDAQRAPSGRRAITISTHTALQPWWHLFQHDPAGYAARKELYAERLLSAAERALPGLRAAARLVKPGTPVTFQRFTRRDWGWVGGFPQSTLRENWGPRLAPGLWMVGDTIFPGQSTAATALGALRVADAILA
ncbi:MAG: NAD(P)/FAD-dependent oxidoreductase [Caldilineaceae bacterium]